MLLGYFVSFALGACVASFVNVVSLRLPKGESWVRGRSHCLHCKKELRWYELIPVVSYIVQRGCCRRCGKHIAIRYLAVELVLGTLFVMVTSRVIGETGEYFLILAGWILMSTLLLSFLSDYTYNVLPVGLMAVAGLIVFVIEASVADSTMSFILWRMVAAAIGALWFGIQYCISRGRWVGEGDIIFGLVIGLVLGWPQIFMVLWFAYVIGGAVASMLLLAKKATFGSKLPMGTFLAVASAIVYFWGGYFEAWFRII